MAIVEVAGVHGVLLSKILDVRGGHNKVEKQITAVDTILRRPRVAEELTSHPGLFSTRTGYIRDRSILWGRVANDITMTPLRPNETSARIYGL